MGAFVTFKDDDDALGEVMNLEYPAINGQLESQMQLGALQYPRYPMASLAEHHHFLEIMAGTYDSKIKNMRMNVKSRGSLNVPIPKHCGTLFLVPHCCVWVLEPSGESTAQAVPLHYNCVRTLGSYLAVMFNTPPSKLGNDFPLSQSSFRNSFPLENKLQNTLFLYLVADC